MAKSKTNQFFPEHACDLRCILKTDTAECVGWFRYSSRRLGMTAAYGLIWCFGLLSTFCSQHASIRLFQVWSRTWMKTTGARVEISGDLSSNMPILLVANHMSYFDMIIMMTAHPFIMVNAKEMRKHPIVGRLLRNTGAIFVARESLSSLRSFVADVSAALDRGNSVVVFPEGRIRCSAPGGPFAPAVMQAAIDARVPVRPVLMWCELADGRPTSRASWLGSEPLRHSLQRLQRIRGLTVKLRVLPDIDPANVSNRNELARLARASIAAASDHFPITCISSQPTDSRAAIFTSIEGVPQR
jgi:1-acyl-sn-glycerol-3-phosphate acyltransferase